MSQSPVVSAETTQVAHRAFLNRYYGVSRHFYDLTRKYYLLGRDQEIAQLLREDWKSLVEIGPGTGRNLRALHKRRPSAHLGGVEASDEMLRHARERCRFASLVYGFAEETALTEVLGMPPDRILFSYCLSMVQQPLAAVENALASLSPNGEVVIVDFGDFNSLPPLFSGGLRGWLNAFHVHPLDVKDLATLGAQIEFGAGGYYFRARIGRTDQSSP